MSSTTLHYWDRETLAKPHSKCLRVISLNVSHLLDKLSLQAQHAWDA